jgi:hypothetical protein
MPRWRENIVCGSAGQSYFEEVREDVDPVDPLLIRNPAPLLIRSQRDQLEIEVPEDSCEHLTIERGWWMLAHRCVGGQGRALQGLCPPCGHSDGSAENWD